MYLLTYAPCPIHSRTCNTTIQHFISPTHHLNIPLNKALDDTLRRRRILLEHDLAVLNKRVRLDEHLARLLLLQDEVADRAVPAGQRRRERGVERARAGAVRGALAHLQLDEELARGVAPAGEHLLAVDADVEVLEAAVGAADFFEASNARLDEVLGDAQASQLHVSSNYMG